jgi:hypothetical protein
MLIVCLALACVPDPEGREARMSSLQADLAPVFENLSPADQDVIAEILATLSPNECMSIASTNICLADSKPLADDPDDGLETNYHCHDIVSYYTAVGDCGTCSPRDKRITTYRITQHYYDCGYGMCCSGGALWESVNTYCEPC